MPRKKDFFLKLFHGKELESLAWRRCSNAAYGVLTKLKVLASANAARPGYLAHPASGSPFADRDLAKDCGCESEYRHFQNQLRELLQAGALQRDPDGVLFIPELVAQKLENEKWRDDKDRQRTLFDPPLSVPMSVPQLQVQNRIEREPAPPVFNQARELPRPDGPGWDLWAKAWREARHSEPTAEPRELERLAQALTTHGPEKLAIAAAMFCRSERVKCHNLKVFLRASMLSDFTGKAAAVLRDRDYYARQAQAKQDEAKRQEDDKKRRLELLNREAVKRDADALRQLAGGEGEGPTPIAKLLPGLPERRETTTEAKA